MRKTSVSLLFSAIACIILLLESGCGTQDQILIGFSGQLSGAYADLGIKGRDGVLLAVENINAKGGINGRKLKLIVQDDKGTPDGAKTADMALVKAGVVAIIGHMTSGLTMAALPVLSETDTVMVSPTTSTVELTGLDDNFFRMAVTCATEARFLTRHMRENRGLSRPAVIRDQDNAAYTNAYWDAFSREFTDTGGRVIGDWRFSSGRKPDFSRILKEIKTGAPDALLIIASPLDTALLAQKIRAADPVIPLFSSGWGQTDALLQNGGHAVEGIEIVIYFNSNSQNPQFIEFRNRYASKFGRDPTFAGGTGYEAMMVLAEALGRTSGSKKGLKTALQKIKNFEGLVGSISMDKYGDVIRTHFLHTVKNGKFVTKAAIEQGPGNGES